MGGTDYLFHSKDATSQAIIASNQWTYVILQNYSTEPTHLVDGQHSLANHYAYGKQLCQQVMTNNPGARVVLFETWSRSAAHPLITGVSSPGSFASTAEFQTELRTNYQGLADILNATHSANPSVQVAPVGAAWENAGGLRAASDPLFVPLFASDNYHGNNNGYYLAACVFYSLIYGVSPQGLSTHPLVAGLNLGLTVSPVLLEATAWATVSDSTQNGVQAFLFDFGSATAGTTNGPAPNDSQNHWNNITEAIGCSPTGNLQGLTSATGQSTDAGFITLNPFNGVNENGSTSSTALPSNATRDSLYGNTELFNTRSNIFPGFKLTSLNPARTYSFTFYASRTSAADNRETRYSVMGLNSGAVALNPANNVDETAVVAAITPDAAGEITISLAPTLNNDNAYHFTYLGAMRVDAVPRQEPVVFTQHPGSQTVYERQPASFAAAVQGTPPFFIQWLSNDIPIPGANLLSYTIPSVTTNMDGVRFAVTVSNLMFSASSSNATLSVLPASQNSAGSAVLFDFGGANTTLHGPVPDDPANYWNNVTSSFGSSSSASLTNLVTADNVPTTLGLVMLSRFNGPNENGTLSSPWLPQDATRDSLFGNTEEFSGLANVFPRFKLTGLNLAARYNLTFYASRTGIGDNRETGYTVAGANSGFGALNVANNITNTATVSGIIPTAAQEITVALTPTANNNNANHFTYLGVLRVEPVFPAPDFLPPVLVGGQVKLEWKGSGQLQWAPSLLGPWTSITPQPASPYAEAVVDDANRFFRLLPSR